MGRLGADAFAELVEDGTAQLDQALSWHLTSNHYPPVPTFFIPTCKAAIEAGQDEDWDREIPLPRGCVTHSVIGIEPNEAGEYVHNADDPTCEITSAITWKDDRDVATASALIESFHLDSFL